MPLINCILSADLISRLDRSKEIFQCKTRAELIRLFLEEGLNVRMRTVEKFTVCEDCKNGTHCGGGYMYTSADGNNRNLLPEERRMLAWHCVCAVCLKAGSAASSIAASSTPSPNPSPGNPGTPSFFTPGFFAAGENPLLTKTGYGDQYLAMRIGQATLSELPGGDLKELAESLADMGIRPTAGTEQDFEEQIRRVVLKIGWEQDVRPDGYTCYFQTPETLRPALEPALKPALGPALGTSAITAPPTPAARALPTQGTAQGTAQWVQSEIEAGEWSGLTVDEIMETLRMNVRPKDLPALRASIRKMLVEMRWNREEGQNGEDLWMRPEREE